MEKLNADGSSLSDDDKNFLQNVHNQKKYYEVFFFAQFEDNILSCYYMDKKIINLLNFVVNLCKTFTS